MNINKKKRLRVYIAVSSIAVLAIIMALSITNILHPGAFFHSGGKDSQLPALQFVTRSNSQLLLNNSPFHFVGANMHWLALDDSGNYTSHSEVEDGFATAKAMGLTVVRSHSLGISVGCPNCIEPRLGVFNSDSFQHVDDAINAARAYGIHLIIPLTDNYHYATGGKHTFTDWRSIANENEFYTNAQVIQDFETYISALLNHVNTYTGIAYKDESTIMAWETGNELIPPTSWTQQISTYIKSIDSKHLVIDGRQGIDPQVASLSNVDIVSNHYYPMDSKQVASEAENAQKVGKVFLAGEFQWNDTYGGDDLKTFLSTILSKPVIGGALLWELWPHRDSYGFLSNQPKFTLHYPGDTSFMQSQVNLLRTYAFEAAHVSQPAESVVGSPLLSTIIRTDSQNTLLWHGAVGAASYSIERSTASANGPWTTICDKCATDMDVPWIDSSLPSSATWYKVVPYTLAGVAGSSSNVYQARAGSLLVDTLDNWSNTYEHSSNLSFDSVNSQYMSNDSSVVTRATATHEHITWRERGITSFQAITYFWPNEQIDNFSIYTSADGNTWKLTQPEMSEVAGNWPQYVYSVNGLSDTNYVKIVWNNIHGKNWSPTLGEISISYIQ
jgi:hypothetical protein